MEVDEVRVAAIAVGRSRPKVAVGARTAERRIAAIASGRKEDGIAVGASNLIAIHTVLRSPLPSTLFDKFLDFIRGRHTPFVTPVCRGCIVRSGQVAVRTDNAARLQLLY